MKDKVRTFLIVISGFLMILLLEIFPIGDEGLMIIEMLKIPFLIFLSVSLGVMYFSYYRIYKPNVKKRAFVIMLIIMILLNLILYPY